MTKNRMSNPHSEQRSRRYTLVLLTMLSAVTFMDRQILAVLLEPIKREFGFTDLQIGLITGMGFAVTFGLLGLPLGRLADKHERRSLIAWCRGLGGCIASLGAFATGAGGLTASRAGAALGDAGGGAASMSILADLYGPSERSRVMSVFGMGASAGALLALLLGPTLAEMWGWRATMAVIGCASVVLAWVLQLTVQEPARADRMVQPAGSATPTTTTPAIVLIWREPVTRWLIIGAACALLACLSVGAWNMALLSRRFNISLTDAGWISATGAVLSVTGNLISGWTTDRMAQRHLRWQLGVPLVALSLATVFGMGYLLMGEQHFYISIALLMGYSFFAPWWASATYAALSLVVPSQRRATASAMVLMSGALLGNGLGPIASGWLSDVFNAMAPGQGLRYALLVMMCVMIPGLMAYAKAMMFYPKAYRTLYAPAAA